MEPSLPWFPWIILLNVAVVGDLVSREGRSKKHPFTTHGSISYKDAVGSTLYHFPTMFLFMGTSRKIQGPMSVPSRDVLLSIWFILSSWTVNCITDWVSLFELAARKLRAKCMAHLLAVRQLLRDAFCVPVFIILFFLLILFFHAN